RGGCSRRAPAAGGWAPRRRPDPRAASAGTASTSAAAWRPAYGCDAGHTAAFFRGGWPDPVRRDPVPQRGGTGPAARPDAVRGGDPSHPAAVNRRGDRGRVVAGSGQPRRWGRQREVTVAGWGSFVALGDSFTEGLD